MGQSSELFTILIIGFTVWTSIVGFRDPVFRERFIFSPQHILRGKHYERLVTSAFLHADWGHLFWNMFSFYSFGSLIEYGHGALILLAVYFGSIVGGGLLSLFLHRHHDYRAYGASGGVCGVIFASIFVGVGGVRFMLIPFFMPAWLYAIVYLLVSFYGIKNNRDNVGHDAHLGGAITGLLIATAYDPAIIHERPYVFWGVMGLSLLLLGWIVKNPLFLPWSSFSAFLFKPRSRSSRGARDTVDEMRQVNALLDKISRSGIHSLTAAEHKLLSEASRKNRGNRPGR